MDTDEHRSEELVEYSFKVNGKAESGTKVKVSGTLFDAPNYPQSAFKKARILAVQTTGTFTPSEKNGVVLRQLRRKSRPSLSV